MVNSRIYCPDEPEGGYPRIYSMPDKPEGGYPMIFCV